jgi:threonine 3-dehydrogenase
MLIGTSCTLRGGAASARRVLGGSQWQVPSAPQSSFSNTGTHGWYGSTPRTGNILVTGATGQIGSELVPHLRKKFGDSRVVASDIKSPAADSKVGESGSFVYCDVQQEDGLARIVLEHGIGTVIHLASLLSAIGEKNPGLALKVNNRGFENVMEVAKQNELKVFAPSSIAVYGDGVQRDNTPDLSIHRPSTMYGITKVHCELLGIYNQQKFGVDFRSLRFPGIISSEAWPGGGTTDYAVEIFYEALLNGSYQCFLSKDTVLPMMYMPDTLRSITGLLDAADEKLTQRVYNVAAFSFTPEQLQQSIAKCMPGFEISYQPDFRQQIADTWPRSLDDSQARKDWDWEPEYDLDGMVEDMLEKLEGRLIKLGRLPGRVGRKLYGGAQVPPQVDVLPAADKVSE